MLWLCTYLPQLPLEALAPPESVPVAIVESHGPRKVLTFVSATATQRALAVGMPMSAALALAPDVRLLTRALDQERQALDAVACWAYTLGRPVTIAADLLCVYAEIGASLKLHGGGVGIWQRISKREADLPYECRYGVAPTQGAALILARASAGFKGAVLRREDIPKRLGGLPLSALPLSDNAMKVLIGSGLRTIGEVLAVPAAALGRRFGPEAAAALDRLVGRRPDTYVSYEPPQTYHRRVEFAGGIETTEGLLFPLRPMLADFCNYLQARDITVQGFVLTFIDLGRRRSTLPMALLAPTRDPARLLLVLREKLAHVELAEPVLELVLEADRFEGAVAISQDLFDDTAGDGEKLQALTERLVARLGRDAVRRLWVAPNHRPDLSWSSSPCAVSAEHPRRPLWLLPVPERIAMPTLLGPPERIESGWWQPVARRDYFLAEDPRGRKLWVYREAGSEQWWLHGLWQ